MKKQLVLSVILTLVFSVGLVVAAKPDFMAGEVTNPVTGVVKTVTLPARAVEIAPNVFYLGTAVDNGKIVEGYAFIDYKKRFAKPETVCGNGICEPGENPKKCPEDCVGGGGTSDCYGFLSRGAKWKTVEDYIVDPTNTRGLDESFVRNNIADDIGKWETAASYNILGNEIINGTVDGADMVSPDGKNEVYFGDIDQPGAIGVTIIWGIFYGPPKNRELVEWDQIYNQVDFDWSEDCLSENCSDKMDFESIATHELGHSVGLDDLYNSDCSEMTMYGYANYGETKKRTLENGDKTGVSKLYS
ncbi:MAG: matrixin family metalloprotease [Candidatus Aenigmarchaeota archaeon]|nr:matrixin family metalloprotease [Candidatus Aenigmarchaeota archaeon]